MEKVYVVTQGCYSDYRIVAIFSTREGAEQFAPAAKSDPKGVRNAAEIVEWDLGPPEGALQLVYVAAMQLDTGALHPKYEPFEDVRPRDWSDSSVSRLPGHPEMVYGRSVISQEHANKVAAERRQAELRAAAEPIPQALA